MAIPPGSAGWTGEPGTSQSVTPARADINTPHREVGTDPSRARAAMAPPWTHGQGRFSSELGLRRRCLKYHRAACGCHRLWGMPHFLLHRAQAPSQSTQPRTALQLAGTPPTCPMHISGDIHTLLLAQRCLALPDHFQLPDAKQRVNSLLKASRAIPNPGRGATSPPSKQEFV